MLDVSNLLELNTTRDRSTPSLEADLVEQFVQAGWPKEALFSQYRPEVRSGFITDLAILDIDRNWQLAIEVKPSGFLGHRNIRPLMDRLFNSTQAEWVCVTDGTQFHLAHRGASGQLSLEDAPSPSALGFDATAQNLLEDDPLYTDTLRPPSVEELAVAIKQHRPDGVTLDPTIPWERFGDELEGTGYYRYGRAIVDLTKEFLSDDDYKRLRKALRMANRGRAGAQHVLLAYLCSLPFIKTLSTFANDHFLTSSGEDKYKEYLSKRLPLCSVVEFPAQVVRPLSPVPSSEFYLASSVLYLGGDRESAYFDNLTSVGDLTKPWIRPWYESFSKWMANEKPTTGYTNKVKPWQQWSFAANVPAVDETLKRLKKLGNLIELGELCQFYRAGGPYRGREETNQGTSEEVALEADDLVLSEFLQADGFGNIVERVRAPETLSAGHIALRIVDDRVFPEYLAEYLNSPTARKLLAASAVMGHSAPRNSVERLRELPVPIVGGAAKEGFDKIEQSQDKLRSKIEEIESRRRSLFEAQTGDTFRDRLAELARLGDLVSASTDLVEERPEFRITAFYPFPLAFGYRLLTSYVEPNELYREQLRISENMLAFLASVSLALLEEKDREGVKSRFPEWWSGGISPGGWRDVVRRCATVFGEYKLHPLASSIEQLRVEKQDRKGFPADVQFLIGSKNDFKHDRGPATSDAVRQHSEQMQERLASCMEALGFLTGHPIRQVRDSDMSRDNTRAYIRCLRYMGDHPGLAQENLVFPRALTKDDLYVELAPNDWTNLYPFISTGTCYSCKARETYFIDKWDKKSGTAYLKSFERGHLERSQEIAQALSEWGDV